MNDKQKLECYLDTRISSKTGKEYKVAIIKLIDGIEKIVFLDQKDLKLLELSKK